MKIKQYSFYVFIVIVGFIACKENSTNPQQPKDKVGTVFSTENSPLPSNHIFKVAVDKIGLVWLFLSEMPDYSKKYLAIFDGKNWDIQKFDYPSASSFAFDKENTAWIGTNGVASAGILLHYDGNKWTKFDKNNSPLGQTSHFAIYSVAIDTLNNIWVGTNRGLAFYDREKWRMFTNDNSNLNNNVIYDLAFDSNNNLWLTTGEGSITYFDGQDFIFYDFLDYGYDNHGSQNLVIDSNNQKWMTPSYMGIARFVAESMYVYNRNNSEIPGYPNEALALGSENDIWTAYGGKQPSGEGAALIHLQNGNKWTLYTQKNSNLPSPVIYEIATNKESGNVWVATNNGLFLLDSKDIRK